MATVMKYADFRTKEEAYEALEAIGVNTVELRESTYSLRALFQLYEGLTMVRSALGPKMRR